jgi:hypothetical protein
MAHGSPDAPRPVPVAGFAVTYHRETDRLTVTLPGAAIGPRWEGWEVIAEARPWRAPGPPPHGPALALQAGAPATATGWATVERITVRRAGCAARLVQEPHPDGTTRLFLDELEAEPAGRDVLALYEGGRRLLRVAVTHLGGRPAQLTPADKRRVLAALLRRAVRDGTPPGALTLDLMAELLDEACARGAIRVEGRRLALPPPLADHALDPEASRRRRRERLRQWLADIGLPRWSEARIALLGGSS